jgi:DNA polymerase
MFTIVLDFETRSELMLTKPNDVGTWRYSEHSSTEILCAGYLVRNEGEFIEKGVWIRGDKSPPGFLRYMKGQYRIKAFNAPFEIAIWNNVAVKKLGWPVVPLEKWECLMSRALVQALPGNLDMLSHALDLPIKKDMEGHKLMLKMCKPLPQRGKTKGMKWLEDEESMQKNADYCLTDVEAEDLTDQRLRPLLLKERKLWLLDQRINQRGFKIDVESVYAASELINEEEKRFESAITKLTDEVITKPTQVQRIKKWVDDNGYPLPDVQEKTLKKAIQDIDIPDPVKGIFNIRLQANSISVKKIKAMLRYKTKDDTIKYNTIHHKAKTGRWAGTGVQPHNFPRGKLENNERFFDLLKQKDFACIDFIFGDCLKTLSICLRNFIVPRKGHKFLVGDFSSVESITLNYIAGAKKKLELYRKGEDIYKYTASQVVYNKRADLITKDERFIGKISELALGYQGSLGALSSMAEAFDILMEPIGTEGNFLIGGKNALEIVKKWRRANPKIVQFWYNTERAAINAVETKQVQICQGIKWGMWKDFLCAKLPSGRYLYYCQPELTYRDGYAKLTIMDKVKKWSRQPTYGGRLVENLIQAICRDLLVEAMFRLDEKGYKQIFTVHDETIAEVKIDDKTKSLKEFLELLSMKPDWAKDYPISASGWEGMRYAKE